MVIITLERGGVQIVKSRENEQMKMERLEEKTKKTRFKKTKDGDLHFRRLL